MTKKYLIPAALMASFAGGFVAEQVNPFAANAKSLEHSAVVEVCVPDGSAVANTWENFLAARLCPQIVAEFGIDLEDCTPEMFRKSAGVTGKHRAARPEDDPPVAGGWCYRNRQTMTGEWMIAPE